jgi:hypothetical protein
MDSVAFDKRAQPAVEGGFKKEHDIGTASSIGIAYGN